MNYKLLFPTYRNRHRFIDDNLREFAKSKFQVALNLGTGEGDYDAMIAGFCERLTACDINEQDIVFAKKLNQGIPNIHYHIEDALDLSFSDQSFDLLATVDVIEHVGKPERMLEEMARVMKKGGLVFITFPSLDFPFTYDPINRFLSYFGDKKISQGAYAFGHEYLISPDSFRKWTQKYGFEIVKEKNLSGYLIALLEMYWTGIIQRVFKANATNVSEKEERKMAVRPSLNEPYLVKLTDAIIKIDRAVFKNARHSVGKGFVLKKL